MANNFDAPLQKPAEDSLNRENFAKRIFTLIDNVPNDTNLRVGILGDWGSGKTTVINFIKYYCTLEEHPVAFFNPWQFNSKEDAWKGFVACIDNGLACWEKSCFNILKRKRYLRHFFSKIRNLFVILNPTIGKALSEMILSPLENRLDETKSNVTKVLQKKLNGKKLFVFIDDLDRADPEIIYDLLMLLNEIFDISQCIYIISLDPKTISDVIKKKLNSTNSNDFLDKIITWKFELPVPTINDWKNLLESELNSAAQELDKDAITSIVQIIPNNPRKFKHFLRYLNSLHKGFLYRFNRDELDWRMLYLAQMLRLEFPDVFRKIMRDNEVLMDIAVGRLKDRAQERFQQSRRNENEESEIVPVWKDRIEKKIKEFENIDDRFFEIYGKLFNCGGNTTPERVRNHLQVIENPELMTWKEYSDLKQKIMGMKNKKIIDILKESVDSNNKNEEIEKIREFTKMLMWDLNQIWGKLVSLETEEEMKIQIKEVHNIMNISNLLTDIDDIFHGINPIFDISTFKEWFTYLTAWAHFNIPEEFYKKPRDEEKKILIKIIKKNLHNASEISNRFFHDQGSFDLGERSRFLIDVFKEIEEILDKRLADDLLDRFKRIDGIKELWPSNLFQREKYIFFEKNSLFHTKANYKELSNLAKEANKDVGIHKNFIEILNIIFYHSSKGVGSERAKNAQQRIKKEAFFNIIWEGATCRPLNLRTVGTLEDYMSKISNDLNGEIKFKRPQWWKVLIKDINVD